jgi:hypothetical protein
VLGRMVAAVKNVVVGWVRLVENEVERLLDPARDRASVLAGAVRDAVRPRTELIAENALLRQQLIVVRRKVKRPTFNDGD